MAAQNKVRQLWTTFVTALLTLCTALGLITTTAATAAAQTGTAHEGTAHPTRSAPRTPSASTVHRPLPRARALPPTMKQRIGAEAHGKSPSCRHRPLDDATEAEEPVTEPEARVPAQAQAPALQRC